MHILDNKGRLFGKVSILDLAAALVILLAIAGVFLIPGGSGSVAQLGVQTKPVEVDVVIRGLTASNPQTLIQQIRASKTANIVVRNQPAGAVSVKGIKQLPRTVPVPQPNGSVEAKDDPRPEVQIVVDLLMTIAGNAQVNDAGVVLSNSKLKIGTPVELEGKLYNMTGSIVDVRVESES